MSIRIHVRQGGSSADNPDLANLAEPREGIPIIEGDTPLIEFSQRWEQGTAGRGQFTYVNTDGNADYRFAAHCEVKLIEDASGDDVVLGWGRIEGGDDVGRRTPVGIGDDEIQHNSVGIMDCNVDLRGLPFRNGWSRPAETSWARLQALEAAKLDGSSSSETLRRASTDIRIENFANNHLVDSSDPVDLDAKDYPVGTFVEEVLADILEEWGKAWGVTIHHRLGSSHRCLLVLDPDDLATFTSALRISDQLADHDPDDLSAPTLAPHWRRANGKTSDNGEVISGLISIFGGTTDDPRHLYVETGDPEDEAETWVDVYQDDLAANGTQAERRANHILNDRRRAYSSFQPSILLDPLQVGLITAGQSIEVKSVVYNQGPDRHDWVWVRIAQITWEPAPDGRWWAHLELERPRGTRARAGGGQPRSTNPKPAPSPFPDPGDTTVIDWDWSGCTNPSFTDAFDSTTGNPWGGGTPNGWTTPFCNSGTNHNAYSKKFAVTPGDTLHVVYTSAKYGGPVGTVSFRVRFYNSGGGVLSSTDNTLDRGYLSGEGGPHGVFITDSCDVTVPVSAAYAALAQTTWSAFYTQHVVVTIPGGDPPESDEEAVDYGDYPHDSPFFLPSDYVEARLDELQAQIAALPDAIQDLLSWKEPVRVATTANGTLATAFENGDSVDGVTLATGDRILIKDQSTGADNGIYVVAATGAPARADDFLLDSDVIGTVVYVTAGTANADSVWTLTTEAPAIGTTALVFAELSGGGGGALDDVTDVNAPSPSDGEVLTWDDGAGEWVAAAPTGGGGGGGGAASLWVMAKSDSLGDQTLTASVDNQITFDTAEYDDGESVIDVANERLVVPTTGTYLIIPNWAWLSTVPGRWTLDARVNGSSVLALIRSTAASADQNGTANHTIAVRLTAGDLITLYANPGGASGVVARGTSASQTRTKISLVRLPGASASGGGAASQVDYAEITSPVSVSSTTEGTPTTVITGNAVTYDGTTAVLIEASAPYIAAPTNAAGNNTVLLLYDGSTSIGRIGFVSCEVAGQSARVPLRAARRLTPSAGSHTYSIRGYASHATGGEVLAGAGGASTAVPAFLRITRDGGIGNVLALPTASTISIPSLALGDRVPSSPGTYDEEFSGTADTLPSGWAWTAAPSGSDTWTLNSRWASLLTVEGTGNTIYTLTRTSFTAAATFGIWCKAHMGPLIAADAAALRFYVSNAGATEQRGMNFRATGANTNGVRGLKIIASAETVWATEVGPGRVGSLYMGMTRDGSNQWSMWVSSDGIAWERLANAAQAHTFTIDRMRITLGTSSALSLVGLDWIRYRTDNAFPRP